MGLLTIFPSAGHHLNDPGAVYHGYTEASLMIMFRNKLTKILDDLGYKFIIDKDHETNTQYQNRIKPGVGSVIADYHANAALNQNASGVECFVSDNPTVNSLKMANELCAVTAEILNIPNRGVKKPSETARGTIGILKKPGTVVLCELFFLSNKNDLEKFLKNIDALANAHAYILAKYEDLIP
ncbi:N-acetylmuramoyl-L-alanine amidase [Flavobacterium agricola]|uniref:N-acetylmuramoyl-L-alanine amidase n=1 Tax=Flavobacterium agricola TaxID=2870839 RepID=A0ABY6M121_9FLAO|nr:N-acetylmuramoyl-L-alanine amidase [Flavobacterium agricola]UYW02131.1 N-acetylmuramoyl-L-alanine amidase [Flavobacterium agricola]